MSSISSKAEQRSVAPDENIGLVSREQEEQMRTNPMLPVRLPLFPNVESWADEKKKSWGEGAVLLTGSCNTQAAIVHFKRKSINGKGTVQRKNKIIIKYTTEAGTRLTSSGT